VLDCVALESKTRDRSGVVCVNSIISLPLVCYYDGISKQEGQLCTWTLCPHKHDRRILTKILLFSVVRALQNATRNNTYK
jgi:hypothetical protein